MALPVVAQQPAFLTNGLVAYYPFNGNANDESGNGMNGINIGGAVFANDRYNIAGQSILLNGEVGYIRAKTLNNVQNTFSMSIWFRADGADREYYGYAVSPSHGLGTWGDRSVGIGISAGTNQIVIWEHTHDHQEKVGVSAGLYQGWNHICVVYLDRRPAIYINGKVAYEGAASTYDIVRPSNGYGPLNTALFAFQEGGIGGGKSNGNLEIFKGSLDEYRVYNRALSNAEVKALYDYESTPPVSAAVPAGMAPIPAGPFQMGDDRVDATPVHTVTVSAFAMDKWEVSIELWERVRAWGNAHGYDLVAGSSDGPKHPVQSVSWYDVVKWNNARSEMEEKNPAYYEDSSMTVVYRSGGDKDPDGVNWNTGYRLPTEAEWEKAARGGVVGKLYPWGTDEINQSLANYADFKNSTTPIGSYEPNKYGLYDMAGNVWERCWDWHLHYSSEAQVDPRGGINIGGWKVLRGGDAFAGIFYNSVSFRGYDALPKLRGGARTFGFRSVISLLYEPVNLIKQPQSVLVNEGETVQLSVSATGSPPPTYQWFKDGNALPSATNAILSLTNARPTLIGDYFAVAINTYGTATSSVASLNINGVDSGIWKGLVAYFPFGGDDENVVQPDEHTSISGAVPCLDRFLKKNAAYEFGGNSYIQSNVSSNSLPYGGDPCTVSIWCQYRTQGLDDLNDRVIISYGVADQPDPNKIGKLFCLSIIPDKQGFSRIAYRGNFLDYGSEMIAFDHGRWNHLVVTMDNNQVKVFLNGIRLNWQSIANPNWLQAPAFSTLTIGGLDGWGTVSRLYTGSLDELRIYNRALSGPEVKALYESERVPDTLIANQPQSISLVAGAKATFSVTATNLSPLVSLTYQWQKDGNPITGATNSLLTVTNVQPVNIGDYNVVVSGGFQAVTSTSASLSIEGVNSGIWKGLVAWYPFSGNSKDESGRGNDAFAISAQLSTDRFGIANGSYEFFAEGAGMTAAGTSLPVGNSDRTVVFWMKVASPKERYDPVGWGDCSVVGAEWSVFVDPTNSIGIAGCYKDFGINSGILLNNSWHNVAVTFSKSSATVLIDGKIYRVVSSLEVNMDGWNTKQTSLRIGERLIGKLDEIRIYNRALSDSEVKELYESERVPDTIILNPPQSISLVTGAKATFSVTATNSSPLVSLTYQWQKDGNPISGATNSLLTITNVQPVNIGDYNVIISGGFQAVTSASASLSIEGVSSGIWKGLVAYYPFDDGLNDHTGLSPDLKSLGTAKKSLGRFGGSDVSAEFFRDQLNGYSIDLDNNLGSAIKTDVTFSMWVYNAPDDRYDLPQNSFPTSYITYYFFHPFDYQETNIGLLAIHNNFYESSGNNIFFDSLTNPGLKGVGFVKSQYYLKWFHLVAVYENGRNRIYIDGKKVRDGLSGYFGKQFINTNEKIYIGAIPWNLDIENTIGKMSGSLDNIRIYSRGLSDSDVSALYQSERVPDTVITRQPQSASVAVGGSVRLEVEASNPISTVPISYQWFKDGAKLVGATNSTLNLGQLRPEQIGSYTVTVDDGSRTLTSAAANVSLQGVDSSIWKGLIASYAFDGDFSDSSGFGDGLVPYGVVNFVDQGRRPETKVARVTGLDGFLVGPERAWFSGVQPRTVSVWIKPEATSTNVATVLTLGGLENCAQRFSLQVPVAQNGIRFDGGDCTNGLRSKTFTGAPISGKWTHAVLTYDGSSVRCYVNGLASGTAYAVALSTDPIAPLVIGNTVGLGSEGFTGLVDDVRIYNRSLSATEVRALFNYESTGVAPSLPQITRQPTPLSGYEGETLKLSVEASGYQLGYQWQRGGQNLASDVRLSGINNSELQIKGARLDDGGDYRVLVTNSFGAVTSSTVKLTVAPPVRSLVAGLANEVQEGQRMTFPLSMVSTGDVGGLTFKLNYNPAFLTDPKVEWSAVVGQSVNTVNTSVAGEISGSFSLPGAALASGTAALGTVDFRARSVPAQTNVVLSPAVVSVANPSGTLLAAGNGAIAGEGRIRPRKIKGDNNANQRIDIGDAVVVSRLLVGSEETRSWDIGLNDLNASLSLDNGDVIKALRTVVGLDPQPGPMGDAKRLSPALVMEPAPVSTNYSADLVLLDGPAIKVGRPYRVAVRLKAGRGNLTGLSFSLKYPASLELKDKVIGAEIPADALPAWNVSRSRAKLAVIRPKAWAAQSGAVATFTFQPTPEAAKQTKHPISLEEMEVSDTGEGLSAVPSVWLEIGGGLEFTPQLQVKRTSADALSLEIVGPEGLPLALECSEDISDWVETQQVTGLGTSTPVKVTLQTDPNVQAKFWRVRVR